MLPSMGETIALDGQGLPATVRLKLVDHIHATIMTIIDHRTAAHVLKLFYIG